MNTAKHWHSNLCQIGMLGIITDSLYNYIYIYTFQDSFNCPSKNEDIFNKFRMDRALSSSFWFCFELWFRQALSGQNSRLARQESSSLGRYLEDAIGLSQVHKGNCLTIAHMRQLYICQYLVSALTLRQLTMVLHTTQRPVLISKTMIQPPRSRFNA